MVLQSTTLGSFVVMIIINFSSEEGRRVYECDIQESFMETAISVMQEGYEHLPLCVI